jgi:hypothetical protein
MYCILFCLDVDSHNDIKLTHLPSFHIHNTHNLGNLASRHYAARFSSARRYFSFRRGSSEATPLCEHVIPISRLQHVQCLFLLRVLRESTEEIPTVVGCIETSYDLPLAQGFLVSDAWRQRRRRDHQIPADQGECDDVAGTHPCPSSNLWVQRKRGEPSPGPHRIESRLRARSRRPYRRWARWPAEAHNVPLRAFSGSE